MKVTERGSGEEICVGIDDDREESKVERCFYQKLKIPL